MGMVSAESPEAAAVEFTGDEWDGHPEIVQVNKERARSTFYPYESVEAAKTPVSYTHLKIRRFLWRISEHLWRENVWIRV